MDHNGPTSPAMLKLKAASAFVPFASIVNRCSNNEEHNFGKLEQTTITRPSASALWFVVYAHHNMAMTLGNVPEMGPEKGFLFEGFRD
jgi:hypothetical protein